MAMGRRGAEQAPLFVTHQQLRAIGGHPFYEALERVLHAAGFDAFVRAQCARFYAAKTGRPSMAPGVYFRCLLVGYFEGLDSERGIAWRVADSLSLRRFLGLALDTPPPDHSTLSRTRRLLDLETHGQVFTWVLGVLATAGLVRGEDGRRGRDDAGSERGVAVHRAARGRAELRGVFDGAGARLGDRDPDAGAAGAAGSAAEKKGTNAEWVNPHEPDAQITKMKDGRTHLAHKQEQAVDLDTGAVLAVTLTGGAAGDTTTLPTTLDATTANLAHDPGDGGGGDRGAAGPVPRGRRGRQGVPQQRGAGGADRRGAAQLHCGARPRAARLDGQNDRTGRRVCQPPAHPRTPRQGAAPVAGRVA